MAAYDKIRKRLIHIDGVRLILIPHKIQHRCIIKARTDKAKQRLIHATTMAVYEEMRRLHIPWYDPWTNPHVETGIQPLSFWSKVKSWLKKHW